MVHHDGTRETPSAVRETQWIPRGREAVKRVVWSCVICQKIFEGKPYSPPLMPDLPLERVSEGLPFATTGADFAGSLYVKYNIPTESNDKVRLRHIFVCSLLHQLEQYIWSSLKPFQHIHSY